MQKASCIMFIHTFIFQQRIKVCNRMRVLHFTMSLKGYRIFIKAKILQHNLSSHGLT